MGLFKSLFKKAVKKSILVVEDDPETAALLTQLVKIRGYDPIVAGDGIEALDSIRRSRPDLVLLDIMMPKMNGFDVLLKIKSDPKTQAIPVLMCSAINGIKEIERCSKWGAEGFIAKPFNLDRVSQKIDSLLNPESQSETSPTGQN